MDKPRTYNQKKRYLEGYQHAMRRVEALNYELKEWETKATNITQKFSQDNVHSKNVSSKIETCAIELEKIEKKIKREIRYAEKKRDMIDNTINSIRDTRRRELMRLRYINCISVHKIAIMYDKNDDNIYKMLRTAIKQLDI